MKPSPGQAGQMDWSLLLHEGKDGGEGPVESQGCETSSSLQQVISWGIGHCWGSETPGQAWEPQKRGGRPLREAMSPVQNHLLCVPPLPCAPSLLPMEEAGPLYGGSRTVHSTSCLWLQHEPVRRPLRHIAAVKGLQRLGNWSPEGMWLPLGWHSSSLLSTLGPRKPRSAASLLHKPDGRNSSCASVFLSVKN